MIKKIAAFIVVACLLFAGALMVVPKVSAHTEDAPMVKTLYAGKNIPIGTVNVWNDGDDLHVEYVLTGGWMMSESHLMVATSYDKLNQTKTGNAIPGQFTWGQQYSPMVDHDEFTIDLSDNGWATGQKLFIAAHAKVAHVAIGSGSISVLSDGGVGTGPDTGTGAFWSEDGSVWAPAVPCFEHPAWTDVPGATWIWRTALTDPQYEYANVPDGGWYFRQDFTLPTTAFNIDATMVSANADNAEQLAINGVALIADGNDGQERSRWQ